MKLTLNWTEVMKLTASSEGNHADMDAKAPIGKGSAMTPKELVAAGLGGCTAMDVLALLKKHKQDLKSLEIGVDIETSKTGQPSIFTSALITFQATGPVEPKILLEAVHLSQTKYCGVSAMMVKAFPIRYQVLLNGESIGEGEAHF